MKSLTRHITEKLVLNNNTKVRKYNYHPKTKQELKELVEKLIKERGNEADLNDIDTSTITDMSELFYLKDKFNGDISKWDVSNVENMYSMFRGTTFNGDISKWDVSKVKDMSAMFNRAIEFNQDISKWNVSKVTNMQEMFMESKFNKDISKWKLNRNVKRQYMFKKCPIKK